MWKSGNIIKSSFEGFPYMLFWTKKDAPLICIEPWCGITDNINSKGDITIKEGIELLPIMVKLTNTFVKIAKVVSNVAEKVTEVMENVSHTEKYASNAKANAGLTTGKL